MDEPHWPPVVLDGADGEVTGVAWCATEQIPEKLHAAGDDLEAGAPGKSSIVVDQKPRHKLDLLSMKARKGRDAKAKLSQAMGI